MMHSAEHMCERYPHIQLPVFADSSNCLFFCLLLLNRDLKPENVMLDREGHVRLCDFGFATVILSAAEGAAPLQDGCGTVMYMAPELVGKSQKSTHGFPVDWWALGCVLVEMITGEWVVWFLSLFC